MHKESRIGEGGVLQGLKLEEQVLVINFEIEHLYRFEFEESVLKGHGG
jgi:hypothetical protein